MSEVKKLGTSLVDSGMITEDQLQTALGEQKRTGKLLGEILIEQGYISEKDLALTLAQQKGGTFIDIKTASFNPDAIALIPESFARKKLLVPVTLGHDMILIAMVDSFDIQTIDEIQKMTGRYVDVLQATESDILTAIERCYTGAAEKEIRLDELIAAAEATIGSSKDNADMGGVIALVDYLLAYAIKLGATDIHIEPTATIVRTRYRVDGMLQPGPVLPKTLQSAVTTRLKILANLDISITRSPQDGQLQIEYGSKKIALRFSSYPMVHGEKMVMRVLDSSALQVGMDRLGFMPEVLPYYQQVLQKPYGVILITGPTGSGKSTTLYSSLSFINSLDRNIMTIEDPVEYTLPLICQGQVNEKAGLSFASGMRTMLRQDPDVIMVGEMRDGETANIAIQAALTGHLVLSTLHTNEASGAFPRLIDMGAQPFLISSAILAVVAQRLVRTICPSCKVPDTEHDEAHYQVAEDLGLDVKSINFQRGEGCEDCGGTGNRGRIAVVELLIVSDEVRRLIVEQADSMTIEKCAVSEGMDVLTVDGLKKVAAGMISLATLERYGIWQRRI